LERFFRDLPTPIDHVMVTGPGPHYWPLMEIEYEQARLAIGEHLLLALWVARSAAHKAPEKVPAEQRMRPCLSALSGPSSSIAGMQAT